MGNSARSVVMALTRVRAYGPGPLPGTALSIQGNRQPELGRRLAAKSPRVGGAPPVRAYRKARQGPRAFTMACCSFVIRRVPLRLRREARLLHARAVNRRRRFQGQTESWCPCVPGLVSVVLPVYNQAEFLPGSIDSVLAQTHPDFELIIVNDGTRDGVGAVLARYSDHPRIRILTQANQKLSKALSNGFEFPRGSSGPGPRPTT